MLPIFFCLLIPSLFNLFDVSFNTTHKQVPLCCTPSFSPKNPKQISKLNKVKNRLKTVLKGISTCLHGYNDFPFHRGHSFQLWLVRSFFRVIIPSPQPLAAGGTLNPPKLHINFGRGEDVTGNPRPRANPNTLDPPLHHGAGQKPPRTCQRGMRPWNELPTDGECGSEAAYERTCLNLPQNTSVPLQQVEENLGNICTTAARNSLLWGRWKEFFEAQVQAVPVRDLKLILPHPMGLCLPQFLNQRGHDSFALFGHFILHCWRVSHWKFHGDWNISGGGKKSSFLNI